MTDVWNEQNKKRRAEEKRGSRERQHGQRDGDKLQKGEQGSHNEVRQPLVLEKCNADQVLLPQPFPVAVFRLMEDAVDFPAVVPDGLSHVQSPLFLLIILLQMVILTSLFSFGIV